MIGRLIDLSLRQPLLVLAFAALLVAAGVQAWRNLPIDAFPDVSPTQVMVAMRAPGLTPEEVAWRFVFVLGTYQYALADTGRLEVISGGACAGKDFEEAFRQMLPFLEAGLQAPAPREKRG